MGKQSRKYSLVRRFVLLCLFVLSTALNLFPAGTNLPSGWLSFALADDGGDDGGDGDSDGDSDSGDGDGDGSSDGDSGNGDGGNDSGGDSGGSDGGGGDESTGDSASDGGDDSEGGMDLNALVNARRKGTIRPYLELRNKVLDQTGGRIVGIKKVRQKQQFIYIFRVIDRKSRLLDVRINARSAKILQVRGR